MPARGRWICLAECIIVSPPTINHLISHRRNEKERKHVPNALNDDEEDLRMRDRLSVPFARFIRHVAMNVHAPSDDLNIVATRISDSINVANHTCIRFFFLDTYKHT